MNHDREHKALLAILRKARRYAAKGNGQGMSIAKLAAKGLGLPVAEPRKKKRRKKVVRELRQMALF